MIIEEIGTGSGDEDDTTTTTPQKLSDTPQDTTIHNRLSCPTQPTSDGDNQREDRIQNEG